jgi:dTDP-4-amino-4,6-dideoxygalactose transaminase
VEFSTATKRMPASAEAFLPFHRALIETEEIDAVREVLESGWLTTGPRVREFEAAFASFTGARHAVALSSCTAALHLALAALGISEGDEILLPSMTFASTGEVILYFGARPVLIDCAEGSFHMDPDQLASHITSKTKAILPVHYGGFASGMDSILEIARERSLKVVEDAAHALPSRYKGRMVGTLGDITCFSFYATKTITTGEGGMVVTENEEYADRIRILALHGISRDAWMRYAAEGSWRYDILDVGYKYNLTDLQAAIGLVQLAKCKSMRQRRAALATRYTRAIESLPVFEAPPIPGDSEHAWYLYVLRVNPSRLRISRDQVIEELKSRGIGTSVHFIPLHLHPLYQDRLGYRRGQFPHAERQFERAISLPLYPAMSDDDVDRVIEALQDIDRLHRR